MEQGLLIFFGIIFGAVGIIITLFLLRSLRTAYKSKNWPRADGTIQKAATRTAFSDAGEQNHITGYSAEVVEYQYTYSVNGKTYYGQRVTLSDRGVKTRSALDKLARDYREGERVTVYYNPASPQDSVLMPGPSFYNFMPLLTASLFLGIGIGLIYYGTTLLRYI